MIIHPDELLGRYPVQFQVSAESLHDALELDLRVDLARLPVLDPVLRPLEHRLELLDLAHLQSPAHDHLNHRLAQREEVRILEQLVSSGLDEREDHVDQLRGGRVSPTVVLQRAQHHAHDLDPQELLRVVETRLQKLRQVVVLRRADQTRNVAAGQRAGARLQVVEQNLERLRVELDDVELRDETERVVRNREMILARR